MAPVDALRLGPRVTLVRHPPKQLTLECRNPGEHTLGASMKRNRALLLGAVLLVVGKLTLDVKHKKRTKTLYTKSDLLPVLKRPVQA